MIRARGLSRDFGATHALRDATFEVASGETVALLGPNGAGKSTLLQILAGVLRPTGGAGEVAGLRVPEDAARLGTRVGYVPQGESVYPELTVSENLRFFARVHGVPRARVREREAALLRTLRLEERAGDRAGELSGGLRQRVAIAASLMHEPSALLLDEPATGLDPLARERLGEALRALRGERRAILFSTHNLEDAARWADRVVLLARGRVHGSVPAQAPDVLEALVREAEGARA